MTALEKYSKLEGIGLWAASATQQRREVVVSFGDATLVISDSRSQQVLSHWSLPAVTRLNPGKRPALFSPEGDPDEVLELDDAWLIDALKELHAALLPPRSLFDRIRGKIALGLSVGVVVLGAVVLPRALIDHALSVVPSAAQTEISERMMAELRGQGAVVCVSSFGSSALVTLQRTVFQRPVRLVVMRDLPGPEMRVQPLPGRVFVLDERIVQDAQSPEALAGALVISAERAALHDPLRDVLARAGTLAVFRLLTSGDLPDRAMRGQAARAWRAALGVPDIDATIERFERLELSTRPVLDNPIALDPAVAQIGEALRDADPAASAAPARSLLSDGQWVSLQNICDA